MHAECLFMQMTVAFVTVTSELLILSIEICGQLLPSTSSRRDIHFYYRTVPRGAMAKKTQSMLNDKRISLMFLSWATTDLCDKIEQSSW